MKKEKRYGAKKETEKENKTMWSNECGENERLTYERKKNYASDKLKTEYL